MISFSILDDVQNKVCKINECHTNKRMMDILWLTVYFVPNHSYYSLNNIQKVLSNCVYFVVFFSYNKAIVKNLRQPLYVLFKLRFTVPYLFYI